MPKELLVNYRWTYRRVPNVINVPTIVAEEDSRRVTLMWSHNTLAEINAFPQILFAPGPFENPLITAVRYVELHCPEHGIMPLLKWYSVIGAMGFFNVFEVFEVERGV